MLNFNSFTGLAGSDGTDGFLTVASESGSTFDLSSFSDENFALNIDGRNIQIQVARSPDPVFTVLLNLKNVDEAKKAQTALKALGHYTGVIDGLWGRGSVAALRKFKASQSMLPNDDAWDQQTQQALFRAIAG